MLTVTDISAVNAVFFFKTPRPVRDIMLEIYPDATEDRNGRFHAPYDGYECPISGKTFRAGEYLPMEELEDGYRIMGGAPRRFPVAQDLSGQRHEWDGTPAQNRAVWALLLEQSRAHDAIRSNFIGQPGEKVALTLTVSHIHAYDGTYGTVFINIMKDEAGNVVIYKGAKKLAAKDETIKVSAKVKAHNVRDDVKQTLIERPKVTLIEKPAPAPTAADDYASRRAKVIEGLEDMMQTGVATEDEADALLRIWDSINPSV